jgi:molecular chaperone GrpE (heat shock protein)
VKASLDAELVKILRDAGFEQDGEAGQDYDPARHEALDGRAVLGQATVAEVNAVGLSCAGDVVVRAQVRVVPRADPPPGEARAAEASR